MFLLVICNVCPAHRRKKEQEQLSFNCHCTIPQLHRDAEKIDVSSLGYLLLETCQHPSTFGEAEQSSF